MPHIQVLDQVTIDKIAAGEVIERPASIVKELVENAIDAGASSVTVEIRDGGISFIRITDNGCGIASDEVRSAFLRHSTSKIHSVEDLSHISSLGFRGEALSSIAAVTQTELITKTADAETGTRYVIEGGKEVSLEETGAPNGTTFLVRQLFYNVPARRKFLKTPMTEAGHVQDLLIHLALSHPEVSLLFKNNGQEKLRTSGNGKLKDVIYNVYGRDVAANLLEIDYEKNGLRIRGYLGKPIITRGNRNFENFFVNGRYVKSGMISKSLEDAYKDFTMQHKFPFAVLHFSVNGEEIDINVHPTKMELRFQKQQDVYNAVFEGVHRTLLEPELIQRAEVPDPVSGPAPAPGNTAADASGRTGNTGIPFLLRPRQPQQTPAQPSQTQQMQAQAQPQPESSYPSQIREEPAAYRTGGAADNAAPVNPVRSTEPEVHDEDYFIRKMRERVMAYHERKSAAEVSARSEIHGQKEVVLPVHQEENGADPVRREEDETDPVRREENRTEPIRPEENRTDPAPSEAPRQMDLFEENFLKRDVRAEYRLIGQVFDTYWLVQFQDSLYIIDQHAAHERVLYEKTLRGMKTREFTSQYLSPPIILTLSMQEAQVLTEHMDRFSRIGFEIEPFGGDEFAVRAVPDNLFGIAKKELLIEMIDELSDGLTTSMTPDLIDEKVASMSCKAAVKGNNRLSAAEVDALIGELLTLDNPYHCPHGRPTIIAMTKRELEKKFKRIV
ncbi:MAG TPA: DNA mismatch repair endonuclease MutL [Candidatus Mediterraneibacter cottocaccae]|nr:DNA mismatch repair endonuclease MutL [Candidatus Mediterraneibacter cottocaccae]